MEGRIRLNGGVAFRLQAMDSQEMHWQKSTCIDERPCMFVGDCLQNPAALGGIGYCRARAMRQVLVTKELWGGRVFELQEEIQENPILRSRNR